MFSSENPYQTKMQLITWVLFQVIKCNVQVYELLLVGGIIGKMFDRCIMEVLRMEKKENEGERK